MLGLKSIFAMIRSVWLSGRKKRRALSRQRICAWISSMMDPVESPPCEPVARRAYHV